MTDTRRISIPALRFGWLRPLYDLLVRWSMREAVFKPTLVEQAYIQPGHHVLDLGCGTATLAILFKQRRPEAHVIGLDGDPTVLALAKSKLADAEVTIPLDQGPRLRVAVSEPGLRSDLDQSAAASFDTGQQTATLQEVFRILRSGGESHLLILANPTTPSCGASP